MLWQLASFILGSQRMTETKETKTTNKKQQGKTIYDSIIWLPVEPIARESYCLH